MGNGIVALAACLRALLLARHAAAKAAKSCPHCVTLLDEHSLIQAWTRSGGKMLDAGHGYNLSERRSPAQSQANLCMNGRLVPELFIAGVVKAATTSLSNDLELSPAIVWPYKRFWEEPPSYENQFKHKYVLNGFSHGATSKEGHFFDDYFDLGKDYFLESYPFCRQGARVAAIESSPRYFMDPRVPLRVSLWYGDDYKHRLKFVFLLRNPVDRFHSDYWHAHEENWCVEYNNHTFEGIVDELLSGNWRRYVGGTPGCRDRLEASLYRRSIRRWFRMFAPQQFTIVPWLYQTQPGTGGRGSAVVADVLWGALGVPKGEVQPGTHYNVHPHPSIDAELSSEKLLQFKRLIANESSAEVLAHLFSSMPGATLFSYAGGLHDEPAIAQWLENNW